MKPDFSDLVFACGVTLISIGVGFIYWPAALICAGLALLYVGLT